MTIAFAIIAGLCIIACLVISVILFNMGQSCIQDAKLVCYQLSQSYLFGTMLLTTISMGIISILYSLYQLRIAVLAIP